MKYEGVNPVLHLGPEMSAQLIPRSNVVKLLHLKQGHGQGTVAVSDTWPMPALLPIHE